MRVNNFVVHLLSCTSVGHNYFTSPDEWEPHFYDSADPPEMVSLARRCCDCCCWPLSRCPARIRGKCLACGLLGSIFKQSGRRPFMMAASKACAELQTLHATQCPATLCNIWVTASCEGADSGRISGFCAHGGNGLKEIIYIYSRDLFIFVYKKGNIYLHQPNATFKLTQ